MRESENGDCLRELAENKRQRFIERGALCLRVGADFAGEVDGVNREHGSRHRYRPYSTADFRRSKPGRRHLKLARTHLNLGRTRRNLVRTPCNRIRTDCYRRRTDSNRGRTD